MIAIAVVASLVVYAWVSGYIGFQTDKTGNAIALPSFTVNDDDDMVVYVQNVGQGTVQIGAVYVDGEQVADFSTDTSKQIAEGNTVDLLIDDKAYDPNTRYDIKVTTTDGTSMSATGKPGSGGTVIIPAHGDATSITITPDSVTLMAGTTQAYTATATDGSVNWDVTSSTTWAVSGNGGSFSGNTLTAGDVGTGYTITATVSSIVGYASLEVTPATTPVQVAFAVNQVSLGGITTPNSSPQSYDAGQTGISIVASPSGSNTFYSWTCSPAGAVTFGSSTSASTTMNIDDAASGSITVTANFATKVTLRPNAVGTDTHLDPRGTGTANWDRVDEETADGTTTYVRGNSDNNYQTDTYNIADQILTGKITNVGIYIRCQEDNNYQSSVSARTALRIGTGSVEDSSSISLTTSWQNYHTDYTTKSGNLGSGEWTWGNINALQIGVELRSQYTSSYGGYWSYAECTQVWVEVTYVPGLT